ncbi:MAG: DNA alkylation repair protein [Mariniphaga sp.]|nr:DNA alkylation repair protein [Mariniphaga sp.]
MEIESIIRQLKTVADPARQKSSEWYFPTSMKTLGVKSVDLRNLIKEWWKELKGLPPAEMVKLARDLVETRIFECNQVAFELLWKHKKALASITLNDLEALGKYMDNWATTDVFSVLVSGPVWRNNQVADEDILNWLKSGNLWWRRAAIVSTVGLNLKSRGGTGDTRRTLMVCERVIGDRNEMIVKALSWALRELSKHDRTSVEQFMEKHDEVLAKRVRREVYTKLNTGTKSGKGRKK